MTTWTGRAARPLAPAHLRVRSVGGDRAIAWIRRSRVGGDVWDGEVPLGEAAETWRLRIFNGSAVVREVVLAAPGFTYSAALRAADLAAGSAGILSVEIAQGSAMAGWGAPATRLL